MLDNEVPSLLLLQEKLIELRSAALQLEQDHAATDPSARNLLHYLSLRRRDIRPLQAQLSHFGLTSLGDIGAYTMARLNAVIAILESITGHHQAYPEAPVDDQSGPRRLRQNTEALLGAGAQHEHAHIMVTMPTEAATDPQLIEDLLQSGMTVMRINCAHDDASTWQAMADKLIAAKKQLGKSCSVQADLAGPKLRTGPIVCAGRVVKFRPERNLYGHVVKARAIALVDSEQTPLPSGIKDRLVLPTDYIDLCEEGDSIEFEDCRGHHRRAEVFVSTTERQAIHYIKLSQTSYISDQTRLRLIRHNNGALAESHASNIPQVVQPIELHQGDKLVLTRQPEPGRLAQRLVGCDDIIPARIHCSLPEAFDQVEVGHRVWFDDGKIGAVVVAAQAQEMTLEITHSAPQGNKLRPEKGINFPDTKLNLSSLTEKDRQDLAAAVQWADIVALSFVRCAADVIQLHEYLLQLDKPSIGVVLKIENQQAFENLPSILLTGLRLQRPFGVMIARGDLAVEVGFERLAEVQQEILWLCEAAHIPVVWATQILESMAKKGLPSRAEVSDAGMGVFAECAMLNKGPYILQTVELLKGILSRMDSHYQKRRATLRKLSVAEFDPR